MKNTLLTAALCGVLVSPLALFSLAHANEAETEKTETPAEEVKAADGEEAITRSGKEVYESVCMVCHSVEGPAKIAPPIFAVKNHVIQVYPERDAFVQRVIDWVKAPDADDPLMPGAIRKFGLMPPMPQLSDEDLKAVAEFMYDSDMALPEWYKQHYKEEHGEEPKENEKKTTESNE